MNYKTAYDEKNKFIRVKCSGQIDLNGVKQMATDVVRMMKKHNCRIIFNDLCNAHLTNSTFDIYQMPRTLFESGVNFKTKRAILVNEITNDLKYLETTSVNFGHHLKIFNDHDEAIQWLKEDP